ncbi:hypothetical protein AB835_03825 [Candidatus Endobugula sertula]|uniref:AAA+ ATPase domain-containing protein n=1 Tax=Candidatus Endobugula sertula TaxID=62101 RepID=A0A1D2QS83_9GAMM|nr:hypothetical protein AB835_03825 [Candidatus Endobugula sertula]
MLDKTEKNWQQCNHQNLLVEIAEIKQMLLVHLQKGHTQQVVAAGRPLRVLRRDMGSKLGGDYQVGELALLREGEPPACRPQETALTLDKLCETLGLSRFERGLLLLCAGMELDPELPTLFARINPQACPDLALALTLFDGHWSALAPESPLNYYQLIEQHPDHIHVSRKSLTISPWALLYLTGDFSREPLLDACLIPITTQRLILDSHQRSVEQLYRIWRHDNGDIPVVPQLVVASGDEQRQIAALAAEEDEQPLYELNLYNLPLRSDELQRYRRLVEREILTHGCLILIDCQRLQTGGEPEADLYPLRHLLDQLTQVLPTAFVLSARQPITLPTTQVQHLQLPHLTQAEQIELWQYSLAVNNKELLDCQSDTALNATLHQLSAQFHLDGQQVRSIATMAKQTADDTPAALQDSLWQHSREQCRRHLQGLAQVIPPGPLGWDDLILPDTETATLQAMVSQINLRQQVYQQWGFAKQVPYGLGISALFSGSSGTGKTLAARIIASQLQLDLYHIDLSSVVDKYIGETEKNLDKIFQAAENSGAILLFDEADALFGQRSQVQDSRDRYANMGISFLLQRMESYSGLSILTTNLRSSMDDAFIRRLRFIVPFPFPDETQRQRIWRQIFPAIAPTTAIDYHKLARLILAGGSIRNIALHAAFRAAEEEQDITMAHLLHATRREYEKAEKTLDEGLVGDW